MGGKRIAVTDVGGDAGPVRMDVVGKDLGGDGAVAGDYRHRQEARPEEVGDATDVEEPAELRTGETVNPDECPAVVPDPGTPCLGDLNCIYGQECCCGDCFDSIVCDCVNGGFGCYYTDACLGPWCEEPPCCPPGDDWVCDQVWPGNVCVQPPGAEYGKCMTPVELPSCWQDEDCPGGDLCKGASICDCDADCDGADMPGMCLPPEVPQGCCLTEEHCNYPTGTEWGCAQSDPTQPGLCLEWPGYGACWDDDECQSDEACHGATFCPCGDVCGQIQAPGKCLKKAPGKGCLTDDGCPPGEQCVGEKPCVDAEADCEPVAGKCLPAAKGVLCWEKSNCEAGQECVNSIYCSGAAYCQVDEHPGVCLDATPGGCWANADCPVLELDAKLLCTGEWVIPWWDGGDYDADPDFPGECCYLKPGQCLEDDDCLQGQECQGAVYPYLGACADDADDEIPGECVDLNPWPEELCLFDLECGENESCVGEWYCAWDEYCLEPSYPGLCLELPAGGPEFCFENSHCTAVEQCVGAWVCDVIGGEMCGGFMAQAGECTMAPGGLGDPCGPDGGGCLEGLVCCYPCGMEGCTWECQMPCEEEEPWCADGCPMLP